MWALVPWLVALLAIPAFVLTGLRAARAPRGVWTAIARAPFYLAWKLAAYLSLARGFDPNRWERSDRQDSSAPRRVEIAGVPIDAIDMRTAISRLRSAIGAGSLFRVSTINLDFLVHAQRDPELMRIFRRTNLDLADGAPVVWLARLLGVEMPGRVAGADLVPAMIRELAQSGARLFLLGGEGGVAAVAGARLAQLYPGIVIAGTYEPPRASVNEMDNAHILARIAEAKADVLLVAFGHPKQEHWIDQHRDQLSVSVAIGVGCVLDLIAGRARRAPRWMQAVGLEWFYRLAREPRRLGGRYLTDAAWLLPLAAAVVRARLTGPRAAEAV
jgi:N-acetylglucosaminyldiphosphoundecaprenol N-acetyl-beta-D-mannosaminyltransferase